MSRTLLAHHPRHDTETETLLPVPVDLAQVTSAENRATCAPGAPGAPAYSLAATSRSAVALAFNARQYPVSTTVSPPLDTDGTTIGVHHQWAVRKLIPREWERLQGFPDDFTRIPWRGKPPERCPDGLRYKAIGNSMSVPTMRWIGERIELVRTPERRGTAPAPADPAQPDQPAGSP